MLMVVEGQPLELVEDLLTVAPPVGLTVADILHKALQRIVTALRCVDCTQVNFFLSIVLSSDQFGLCTCM